MARLTPRQVETLVAALISGGLFLGGVVFLYMMFKQ